MLTYAKLIRELRPKFIVMENVKGILTLQGGTYLNNVLAQLHEAGYDARYKLINMADYGVPEIRERVIILGNRVGLLWNFHSQIIRTIPMMVCLCGKIVGA